MTMRHKPLFYLILTNVLSSLQPSLSILLWFTRSQFDPTRQMVPSKDSVPAQRGKNNSRNGVWMTMGRRTKAELQGISRWSPKESNRKINSRVAKYFEERNEMNQNSLGYKFESFSFSDSQLVNGLPNFEHPCSSPIHTSKTKPSLHGNPKKAKNRLVSSQGRKRSDYHSHRRNQSGSISLPTGIPRWITCTVHGGSFSSNQGGNEHSESESDLSLGLEDLLVLETSEKVLVELPTASKHLFYPPNRRKPSMHSASMETLTTMYSSMPDACQLDDSLLFVAEEQERELIKLALERSLTDS